MSASTEKFPLDEVAEGRIDDKTFQEFLEAYYYYWHNCHAKGRIEDKVLNDAKRNAIAYAREKGFRLEFGEMDYQLTPASEIQDELPNGTEKSCFAPTYLELSCIVKEAIDLISTMWPKEPGDVEGIAYWLKRNKRFFAGSQRVIDAKRKLHEIYDHSLIEPERDRDILELIASYRHLFYFVNEIDYDAGRNITRYKIEVFLGDILPPFDEHGMDDGAICDYSDKVLVRMLDLGMLTLVEQDDNNGKMTLYINEPENWG